MSEIEERHRAILTRAREDGKVQVSRLATDLDVAPETVRRDLRRLADRGLLQRVHGGAAPVESAGYESDIPCRTRSMTAEKQRIAVSAAALLEGASSVYVDEGITPRLVAKQIALGLSETTRLTIVTPSLLVAEAVANTFNITVLLLGGRVRGLSLATVDHWATRMLAGLVIDLAYLSTSGVSLAHGLTTSDPAVADLKNVVVTRARRRICVGVHNKFGVSSFSRFADIVDFEALVTDTGLSTVQAARYAALGPRVVRA